MSTYASITHARTTEDDAYGGGLGAVQVYKLRAAGGGGPEYRSGPSPTRSSSELYLM